MKVIYAVNSDLGKHGTIGLRTFYVAKEAYKKGYLKKIICRGNSQKDIPKKNIKKVFPLYRIFNLGLSFISQFLVEKFPARKIQLYLFDFFVSKKLKKSNIQADVLHIYEYAPRTIKQAKKLGMKVVLDTQMAHGKTGDKIFNKKGSYKELDACSKLADKIIASSEFVVQSYIEAKVPKEKMALIPHGVDLKKFNFKSQSKTKKFRCLFVGLIEPRKGMEYLLKAWDKLNMPDAELILCGRINLTMKKTVDKFKKRKNIKFTGFTDPIPYYKSANVFILPSLFESSAKVLYEAMAAGLPIITTFNSGPVFKDGEAGFIIPIRDAKAIADKILYLKNNPSIARKTGNNGRNLVRKFTWDIYGKKLIELYKKLLSRR